MNINLTLIGQMGTLLVFWWFVYTYIWPVFSRICEERRQHIAEGLNLANQAKESMKAAQDQSQDLINQAKSQAADILSHAHKQAEQLIEAARLEAKNAGALELDRAREEIAQESRRARESLRDELAGLIVAGAAQVIGREVRADDHQRLLRELGEKL